MRQHPPTRRRLAVAAIALLLVGAALLASRDATEAGTGRRHRGARPGPAAPAALTSWRRIHRHRPRPRPARPPATTTAPTTTTGPAPAPPPRPPAPTAAPAQAPASSPAGFPDAASTGVPAGVALRASGSLTVSRAGTVLDGLDLRGCLTIAADHVTVRRSRIRCTGDYVVRLADGATGVLLEDVELDGMGDPGTIAVGVDGYTVRRADIHGVGDGPRMGDATVVEDSWIHGLAVGGGSHNDGIQSTGGHGIVIRHNRIEHPHQQTSCILLGADLGDIDDALVSGNLLNGGNYTVYAGADRGHRASGIRIVGNRFGRDFVYGPTSFGQGVTAAGNVFDDNGRPIG